MEVIETENGYYIKGTSKILRAKGEIAKPERDVLVFAQVGSSDGVAWVWLSSHPGAPDVLPGEDQ